jgi:hypothetical protein
MAAMVERRVSTGGSHRKEGRMFFFEKKNQKTFVCFACGGWHLPFVLSAVRLNMLFFLFSKK